MAALAASRHAVLASGSSTVTRRGQEPPTQAVAPAQRRSLFGALALAPREAKAVSRTSIKCSASVGNASQAAEDIPHAIDEVDGSERMEDIMTTFRWPSALGGKEVSIAGSFNGWQSEVPLGKSSITGDFVRTMALPPGTYEYKFYVDGDWKSSPCDPSTKNDLGEFNNHRVVASSHTFVWKESWGGSEVFVTGDFAGWTELIPLYREPGTNDLAVTMSLQPGTYSVQYLVDGQWMLSPENEVAPSDKGHQCNKVLVQSPDAFHVYYATGWSRAILMARKADENGAESWLEVPMQTTTSRSSPGGGTWLSATIPVTDSRKLEFVIVGGESTVSMDEMDQPLMSPHYVCPTPGGYKLQDGRLKPFRRASEPPMMLVSDLDGTMVGDDADFDAATFAFSHYWEDNCALTNSVLVYNTGRSVGQFSSLLKEKQGMLAVPDVLITAVGTKIWMLDENRRYAVGNKWKEDMMWSRRLDEGWDLQKARHVGESAVSAFKDRIHWLDNGSEHPHRVAFSVDNTVLEKVIRHLEEGFKNARVQARIITSGTGGWRYVDCVSIRGGKLEALEYVRTLYSVPKDRCVAAGDSGNDILMLAGENRALVVGNAQPELQEWILTQPQDERIVYTDAPGAAGIIEGLARLGLY